MPPFIGTGLVAQDYHCSCKLVNAPMASIMSSQGPLSAGVLKTTKPGRGSRKRGSLVGTELVVSTLAGSYRHLITARWIL